MNNIKRLLRFLRITDESDNLSITNILVIGLTIKIFAIPEIDLFTTAGFIAALLQYGHKRHLIKKSEMDVQSVVEEAQYSIDRMRDDVYNKLELKEKEVEELTSKYSDKIKQLELAVGFKGAVQ